MKARCQFTKINTDTDRDIGKGLQGLPKKESISGIESRDERGRNGRILHFILLPQPFPEVSAFFSAPNNAGDVIVIFTAKTAEPPEKGWIFLRWSLR